MATGWIAATADEINQCYFNGTNITAPTVVAIKLHSGDPSATGTANPATETIRKDLSSAMAASSGGALSSNAAVSWTSIAGSQDATHCSFLTSVTHGAGSPFATGTITANPYTAGDTFTIASGDIDIAQTVAS